MLATSGRLPTRANYAYEVKWDGFRAVVSTERALRVRSRRGWNMTEHVGFLRKLPVRAVLDGERETFDDGPALGEAVCKHELEGLVAKQLHEPYRCGERCWVTVKNHD